MSNSHKNLNDIYEDHPLMNNSTCHVGIFNRCQSVQLFILEGCVTWLENVPMNNSFNSKFAQSLFGHEFDTRSICIITRLWFTVSSVAFLIRFEFSNSRRIPLSSVKFWPGKKKVQILFCKWDLNFSEKPNLKYLHRNKAVTCRCNKSTDFIFRFWPMLMKWKKQEMMQWN